MVDFSKLRGVLGILRVISLALGILVIGLTAGGLYQIFAEMFCLAIFVIAFICSLVILIIFVLEVMPINEYTRAVDAAYHGIAGIGLAIASLMFLALVLGSGNLCAHYDKRDDQECPYGNFIMRLFGAFLAIVNTVVYLLLSLFLYKIKE